MTQLERHQLISRELDSITAIDMLRLRLELFGQILDSTPEWD